MNILATSSLLASLVTLAIGVSVLLRDRTRRTYTTFAAFTFMVPLGISSAAAVRVGHAVGRQDRPAAARAGWRRSDGTAANVIVIGQEVPSSIWWRR